MDRKTRYYSGMSSNKGTAGHQLLLTYWVDSEQVTSEEHISAANETNTIRGFAVRHCQHYGCNRESSNTLFRH